MTPSYIDTVRLLLAIAPAVFASGRFAMKGGTALNLFVQDMPRLSVDIDVVYTNHATDRDTALQQIAAELGVVKQTLEQRGLRVRQPAQAGGDEVRLLISNGAVQVKVEVNFVFRGTVLPVQSKALVASAENLFTTAVTVPVLAKDELYGSKLVAAMDRQHPRDMFDVMLMRGHYGWPDGLTDCFVAYLAGHNRPVHEVLFPKAKPLAAIFSNEFAGMTRDEVSLDALAQTQARLIQDLPQRLLQRHRQFLLSLVQCEPAWELMPFAHLRELPALKWKLLNLSKLKKTSPARFAAQHDELALRFAGG
jgi:Nucleotidyl transferase AbiEii toxin, Type IV TA system